MMSLSAHVAYHIPKRTSFMYPFVLYIIKNVDFGGEPRDRTTSP